MNIHLPTKTSGLTRRKIVILLVAQFVGAVAASATGGFLGMQIGLRFFAGDPSGFGDMVARLGGILVGYLIGCALGAWVIGRWLDCSGPFWAGLLGTVAAISLALPGLRLFSPDAMMLAWLLIWACGALGAVGGLWFARHRWHRAVV